MKIEIECTPDEFKSLFYGENKMQTRGKSLTINAGGGFKNIAASKQNIHDIFDEFKEVDEIHVDVSETFVC